MDVYNTRELKTKRRKPISCIENDFTIVLRDY